MNTKKLVWCCAAVAILMLSGCKPVYEKRIQGTWRVDSHFTNGSEDTDAFLLLFNDYKITFYDNGDFTEEYKGGGFLPVTVTGTWVIEKKTNGKIGELQLRLTGDNSVRIYDIKKCTKDTIDIYRADNGDGDSEEVFLEPPPQAS